MATYNTSRYDKLYKDFAKEQDKIAANQKKQTEADYNQRLKEAYIGNMQNKKALSESLAKAGIRGGATETSNIKLATDYQANRNALNKEKSQAIQNINENAQANKFNYRQTNDAAKLSYIEQREAEDRQLAQAEKEKTEAAKQDYLVARYGGVYNITSLNNSLKKAKTTQEKAIIRARINYLRSYQKGY